MDVKDCVYSSINITRGGQLENITMPFEETYNVQLATRFSNVKKYLNAV